MWEGGGYDKNQSKGLYEAIKGATKGAINGAHLKLVLHLQRCQTDTLLRGLG